MFESIIGSAVAPGNMIRATQDLPALVVIVVPVESSWPIPWRYRRTCVTPR